MFIHVFSALLVCLAVFFAVGIPAWCVHREILDRRQREHEHEQRLFEERVIDLECELDAYRRLLVSSLEGSAP